MENKSKPLSESKNGSLSGMLPKSRSSLCTAHSTGTKPSLVAETQSTRNFCFGKNPNVKKTYQKNSEKMIKPPEKPEKPTRQSGTSADGRRSTSTPEKEKAVLRRGISQISDQITKMGIGDRSLTNSFGQRVTQFSRVDTKTILDLERRLENLQSILLQKVHIWQCHSPERVKREYKFIALVMGNECKLVVNENEAKGFPNFLPAKSLGDLNRKAEEFFVACLLAFTDRIRSYQEEGRTVNCDEIFVELKREQKDYCNILQDWVRDFCEEPDKTLAAPVQVDFSNQGTQTETTCQFLSPFKCMNQEVQTEIVFEEIKEEESKMMSVKMDKLRLENYELKEKLSEERENHKKEMKNLLEEQERKLSEVMKSSQQEKTANTFNEDTFNKERKIHEGLLQQVLELEDQLSDLQEKNDELSSQHQEFENMKSELAKCQIEFQSLQNENIELRVWKSHFLKKQDQRNARIELQDKEIVIQKRTVQMKNEEIEQLRKDFDVKVRENRLIKESLEARNKLIDHLRNAVEIEQKKIREYELELQSRGKPNEPFQNDMEIGRETKPKRTHGGCFKTTRVGSGQLESDKMPLFNQNKDQERKLSSNRSVADDSSEEMDKPFVRDLRPCKRSRDIVVRKYEI